MFEDIFLKFKKCAKNKCKIDISKGRKIIAAVSGGSDSVCMLILLCKLYGKENVICAHFNHKIREEEAIRDAKFVQSLASNMNIEFIYDESDVPYYAKENNIGLEEAARIMRYAFLKRIAGEDSYIAIAHNKGDKIETIIHNILRGTSVDGLRGIEYIRGNIVRPILDLTKSEIEKVCNEFCVKPVFDSTNNDNIYTRNKIRNSIIPYLKKEYNDSVEENILRLSDVAFTDSEFLRKCTLEAYETLCTTQYNPFFRIFVDTNEYSKIDLAIKRRLIRHILSNIKDKNGRFIYPEGTGLYSDIIFRMEKALEISDAGKISEASAGVICVSCHNGAYFTHKDYLENDTMLSFDFEMETKSIDCINILDFKIKPKNIEYFDYDKLILLYGNDFMDRISLRVWNEEDIITPIGMNGTKKIRKLLIDNKIGRYERKFVKVFSLDKDILWIPEIKRSNIAPIDKNSSRVIIIKCALY